MLILGIDPGFANLGLALVETHPRRILAIRLIKTNPEAKKRRLGQLADDERRLTEIETIAEEFIQSAPGPIALAGMEDPPWGKSAKAVKSCAMAWGALHCLLRRFDIPLATVSATDIKKHTTGRRDASKEEVYAAIQQRYPGYTDWPAASNIEHVSDACGAADTATTSPLFLAVAAAARRATGA